MSNLRKILEMTEKFAKAASKKNAVCVCAINGDKVLGVARKGTTDEWGLPGGKIEPQEKPIEALIREVQEETHIKLDPNKCKPIFTRTDEAGYNVITYLYTDDIDQDPKQGDAGPAKWVPWKKILEGPFGEYNQELYKKVMLND